MTQPPVIDVAVVQMAASPGDVDGNIARLVDAIRQHGPTADLVVAPELATTGYDLELIGGRADDLAEPADGRTVTLLGQEAARAGATVVAGFLERDGDQLYDSLAIVTPDGDHTIYRKSHLYPAELPHFAAGDSLDTVITPVAKLGMLICFEHAFPDIATTLALAGAQILVIPSAVPNGFEYLLELRTRARAQDNQVFAIAANLTGNGFCGHSLVATPRGAVVASADSAETVIHAGIDLGAIETERSQEPALRLRRPALYHVPPTAS